MYRKHSILLLLILSFLILTGCENFADLPSEESLDTWEVYKKGKGPVSNNIWCLLADSKGNVWAGTTDRGVMKFDGKEWTSYSSLNGLSGNFASALAEYYNGEIWIGTELGISIYDGSKFNNFSGTNGNVWTVTSIKTLSNGEIWIGTFEHGLYLLSGSDIIPYVSETNENANYITSIDQDKEGTIWAGTYAGLYKINGNQVDFLTEKDGLSSDTVTAVFCDSWGETWIGTYYNEFITRYENGEFRKISLFNSQYSALTNAFAEDSLGNIWMGLVSEGVVKFDGVASRAFSTEDGLPGMSVLDVAVDTTGSIWFGTHHNGIAKYTPGF